MKSLLQNPKWRNWQALKHQNLYYQNPETIVMTFKILVASKKYEYVEKKRPFIIHFMK